MTDVGRDVPSGELANQIDSDRTQRGLDCGVGSDAAQQRGNVDLPLATPGRW
jgi:hypothetical protein